MGYFSQRKNKERCSAFLKTSLTIVGALIFIGFFDNEKNNFYYVINSWRLQYQLTTIILFIIALYFRYFLLAFVAVLLMIINYFSIKSTSNIISNTQISGGTYISVSFEPKNPHGSSLLSLAKYIDVSNLGKMDLAPGYEASFIKLGDTNKSFVVISLNFRKLNHQHQRTALKNLEKFIAQQSVPVVLFGDFGSPIWTRSWQSFLEQTHLEAKNHIIPYKGYNLLVPPTINIVGYNNIGVRKIYKKNGALKFELSIR